MYVTGLLFIQLILVPTWLEMDAEYFLSWAGSFGKTVGAIMAPLLILNIIAGIISIFKMRKVSKRIVFYITLFALLLLMVHLIVLFAYFLPSDLDFANRTIGVNHVRDQLLEWEKWHIGRTIIAFIAWLGVLLSQFR